MSSVAGEGGAEGWAEGNDMMEHEVWGKTGRIKGVQSVTWLD